MRRPRDPESAIPSSATEAAAAAGLEEALHRCASGDAGGLDALKAWGDGRIRASLERLLEDPQLTDRVLATALDDISRNAAMLAAIGRGPLEDRVFGLVRRHAYAALRAAPGGSATSPLARPPATPTPAAPPPVAARLVQPPPPPAPVRAPPPAAEPPAQVAPAQVPPAQVPPAQPPAQAELPPSVPPAPPAEPAMEAEEAVPRPGLRPEGVVTPLPVEPEPEAWRHRPGSSRRPGEHDAADWAEWTDWAEDEPQQQRRWPRVALAWLLAAGVGFALAYLVVLLLSPGSEPSPAPPPASLAPPTAQAPAPQAPASPSVAPVPQPTGQLPPALEAPAPATPPPAATLGTPLQAPEPPAIDPALRAAAPAPSAPAAPPPAAAKPPAAQAPATAARPAQTLDQTLQPLPAQARIFIHYSAGDGLVTALARSLADRLRLHGARAVVVRQVPFAIRGLGVRYFHDADRAAAAQTLDIAERMLGLPDQALGDFTSFAPAPEPGTIEIWLPGGT